VLPVTSGLAIAALVIAILWIGGVGSLAAVILGIVALSQIRSSTGTTRGRGLATAAVVIGVVGVAGTVALVASGVVSTSQSALSPTASPPGGVKAPGVTPASSGVIRELTGVPRSVAAAVGVPPQSLVTPPTIRMDQPKLVVDGKPGAVFIGGVFCPYCAAERWAIIMAFSRFGTFSNLEETTSSPWDVYPATATFSFHGVTYSSRYVGLAMAEHSGNDVDGPDTFSLEDPLTRQEADLWQTYDDSYGYPFLDIGNKTLVLAPSFDPSVLAGLDQQDIASRLTNPEIPSTQAIVGTANYLTAAICSITGLKPASVCLVPVVEKAGQAMELSPGELSPGGRLTAHRAGTRTSTGDTGVLVRASPDPGQHL
jgi:hypothetical protein